MRTRPDCIFEIHQLWQSIFSRVYSNCCCSRSFEPEIIKNGQSSHKMYRNNIVNFEESTTILKPVPKSLDIYWIPSVYIYIYICVCVCVCVCVVIAHLCCFKEDAESNVYDSWNTRMWKLYYDAPPAYCFQKCCRYLLTAFTSARMRVCVCVRVCVCAKIRICLHENKIRHLSRPTSRFYFKKNHKYSIQHFYHLNKTNMWI